MKTTLVVALTFASVAAAAPPVQNSINVVLGPKAYRDGDVIEISEVTATSDRLEQGDSITVRGRVRLDSRESAKACLFLTQTQGDGWEEIDPGQSRAVSKGLTAFELKATIKHQGALHVTLYDSKTGKPLGGTYFGTPQQMSKIAAWDVQYHLAD